MNRIHLLSEQVANQIAAGEVVERPASVVKELVENAVDAGARAITVEIAAGGRSLIRVTDDGAGMSRDDALLCLERHATSKIRRAEDLAAIATMGFRGEALPSIASVSRFTLTTRERDSGSPEGTLVVVQGGKIVDVRAAGGAPGTVIEVRSLFFNLPARRKFLRSEETEYAHIQHYLILAALASPEVAFTLVKDARVVWQLPAETAGPDLPGRLAALRERLRALLGDGLALLPVRFEGQLPAVYADPEDVTPAADSAFRVWGYLGAPGVSRSTRENQHLFVNRRPVDHRGLNYALTEGYHTALMKGRYPVCCLFLELDPSAVDVNIHPAKREVKFHQEKAVQRLVTQAVRQTLVGFHAGTEARTAPTEAAPPPSAPAPAPGFHLTSPPAAPVLPEPAVPDLPHFPRLSRPVPNWPAITPPSPVPPPPAPAVPAPPASEVAPAAVEPAAGVAPAPTPEPVPARAPVATPALDAGQPTPLLHVPLRFLGVLGRLYVLWESDRGLVLMDQHAAHERLLFEQMMRRMESREAAPSQRLLLPETIELSVRDAHFLRQNLDVLNRLGVGLSEFGERTFLLDSLPPFSHAASPRAFLLEMLDELKAAGQGVNLLRLGEHTVAKTVCRHAVKAHDPLSPRELEQLVADLRQCAMPYTCPHGRPTLIEISHRELEKKFGRIQP